MIVAPQALLEYDFVLEVFVVVHFDDHTRIPYADECDGIDIHVLGDNEQGS